MLNFPRRLSFSYLVPDAIIVVASLYLSLLIRVPAEEYEFFLKNLTRYLPIFLSIKMLVFVSTRLYDIIWRYVSVADALIILRAVLLSSIGIVSVTYFMDMGRLPRSMYFIDAALTLIFMMGIRLFWRLFVEEASQRELKRLGRRTLIYGAGENGRTLATRFRTDSQLGFQLIGFVDDDPEKVGMNIAGNRVLGSFKDLPALIRNYRIEELVVAMTQVPGDILTRILQCCREFRLNPKMMSQFSATSEGGRGLKLMRDVELSDLLKRNPRIMNTEPIRELFREKVVLITGAGGSIGSELSRQVFAAEPSKLLILDHSEMNLYQIDQELRPSYVQSERVLPFLVDLKDRDGLERLFSLHKPDIVLHAAAYKHVHLVELNPHSAILNNILGLKHLLEFCEKFRTKNFVLISSDKAVNPVGVMGSTKRVCELMVSDAGRRLKLPYCSVRFGNVLGSSGSLIPLLTKQIQNGEAITLTHPEMNRFFMLIPEAVALVLRAATLATPGDIAILKMGEPIEIVEIARSLLTLLGRSETENPIVFTGLRPGEKMFEELYLSGEEIKTDEPDILIAKEGDKSPPYLGGEELRKLVDELIEGARASDPVALQVLNSLVKQRGESATLKLLNS